MPTSPTCSGEILSNEQQYRVEVASRTDERLPQESEASLVERARAGDAQARHAMCMRLLHMVERAATGLYQQCYGEDRRIEYLDLVQEGNEALLVWFEQALQRDNPFSYLIVVARNAMLKYGSRYCSAILTPNHAVPLPVESLDVPLEPDSDTTHAEMLQDAPATAHVDEEVYAPLYETLERLPGAERELLVHVYGLHEHPPCGVDEAAEVLGWPKEQAWQVKGMALYRLYCLLASHYSTYAQEGVLPVQPGVLYKTQQQADEATRERKRRLEATYTRLQQQDGQVTQSVFRREAGGSTYAAQVYLRTRQGKPLSVPPTNERLRLAYEAALQRGEPRITANKLAQQAHTGGTQACVWLKMHRATMSSAAR
jgi:DNA-directed RNA polymerase specialized sigma24 family protein